MTYLRVTDRARSYMISEAKYSSPPYTWPQSETVVVGDDQML